MDKGDMDAAFNEMLDSLVRATFRDALRASARNPKHIGFFLRTLSPIYLYFPINHNIFEPLPNNLLYSNAKTYIPLI